jgi:uncharacterized protein (TIGR02284 family)
MEGGSTMNTQKDNKEVISTLNSLLETCKDGEDGFRAAGDAIENPDVRTLFHMYAQQRAHFRSELFNEVLRHGGEPAESGHLSASLHRGWMDLKVAISGKNETAIIDECERGEDVAMKAYQEALKEQLPADVMSIVEEQYSEIRHSHETVRGLKRAAHAH